MKQRFIVLTFFLCLTNIFSDEYVIGKFNCVDAHMNTEEITFKYDDVEDVYYIFRSTYSRAYWFSLKTTDLPQLRSVLDKFEDWTKIAKQNNSTITNKEIPNSKLYLDATMKSGNEWYTGARNAMVSFKFSSENNMCILFWQGDSVPSSKNRYIDIDFDSVAFLENMVAEFKNVISEKNIKTKIEEHCIQKKNEDLFK